MAIKMKALIGFGRLKDDELMVLATTIIGAMTNNENFPTPTPDLETITTLLDDYVDKLTIWRKKGSPEDKALKDESRYPLEEELQALAYYVNTTAKGRVSTLLSSGFPVSEPLTNTLVPLVVQSVKASDGRQSGQMRLDFQAQKKVNVYEYSYRKLAEEEQEWSDRFTTTSSRGNIIAPLDPGIYYEVRVRAVNKQGAGDWSQVVKFLVR